MRFVLFLFWIGCVSSLQASDSIIVRKDPRLDLLTAKQAQINKRSAMMPAIASTSHVTPKVYTWPKRGTRI